MSTATGSGNLPSPFFFCECVFNHLVLWNALGSITINRVRVPAVWKSVSALIFEYSFNLLVEWILLSKHLRPFTQRLLPGNACSKGSGNLQTAQTLINFSCPHNAAVSCQHSGDSNRKKAPLYGSKYPTPVASMEGNYSER